MTQRPPKPDPVHETRRETRVPANRAVDVLPTRAGQEMNLIRCRVLDCSLHGIALISPEPFAAGEVFLLSLNLPGEAKVIEYKVLRCVPWQSGGYCVGGRATRFGTPSAERALEAVMAALMSEPKAQK